MDRVILLLAICLPAMNAAGQNCPLLNAATAAGVLEGPVDATVTTNGADATCEFARQRSTEKLRIEVVTMGASRSELPAYKAQCVAPVTALKSIGTDAVACGIGTDARSAVEAIRHQDQEGGNRRAGGGQSAETGVPGPDKRRRGFFTGEAARKSDESGRTSRRKFVLD